MTTNTFIPAQSSISLLTWSTALVLAVGVHLIFFLNYQSPKIVEDVINEQQQGIKIGLKKAITLPSTPKPDTSKAISKPVISKPKAAVKPPALPKPIPTRPVVKKKIQPITKPKPIAVPDTAFKHESTDNLPTEETITSASENEKTETAASSSPLSVGGSNLKVTASYEASLIIWLERYKRYPSAAKRRRQEGVIELEFTIDKQGNVLSQKIISASPYSRLNRAVTNMIKRASPLPAIPKEMQGNKTRFTFVIPVTFKLH